MIHLDIWRCLPSALRWSLVLRGITAQTLTLGDLARRRLRIRSRSWA